MLADYQALVTQFVRDDAGRITAGDRDTAITLALERYSVDRPRTVLADVAADDGYSVPLPAGWQVGFSTVTQLEHPIGQQPPRYLDAAGWRLYYGPTETVIVLDTVISGIVRVSYTVRHVLTNSADTIPLSDREAVAKYAAALLCQQLATLYAGSGDSTIQADAVAYQSKSGDYAKRAREYQQSYQAHLGLLDTSNATAGAVVGWQRPAAHGRGRMFHR